MNPTQTTYLFSILKAFLCNLKNYRVLNVPTKAHSQEFLKVGEVSANVNLRNIIMFSVFNWKCPF